MNAMERESESREGLRKTCIGEREREEDLMNLKGKAKNECEPQREIGFYPEMNKREKQQQNKENKIDFVVVEK